jgi:hypothetical protein
MYHGTHKVQIISFLSLHQSPLHLAAYTLTRIKSPQSATAPVSREVSYFDGCIAPP